ALFRFTGAVRANQSLPERAMDSGDLERERGITILSKVTSIEFEGVRILLVVDAVDGPMPQTRFVLGKALAHRLRPIVVVNKVDRAEQRAAAVVDQVFDLLVELGADDRQLDFPVVYCSAVEGTATRDPETPRRDLRPLLDAILEHAPAPCVDLEGPLQL